MRGIVMLKLVAIFLCLFSVSCDQSPQKVDVYTPGGSNNEVAGKPGTMETGKLKISIFNLGNFGAKSDSETKTRALNIKKNILFNQIYSNNNIYVFLDIIGKSTGKKYFDKFIKSSDLNVKCEYAKYTYSGNESKYTAVCFNTKIQGSSIGLVNPFSFQDNLNEDTSKLTAFNIKFKYDKFEFYFVALDFNAGDVVIDAKTREKHIRQLAEVIEERSGGYPSMIIGDWRNNPDTDEINKQFNILNDAVGDLQLLEAEKTTIIDFDPSASPKKYNNLIFSNSYWAPSRVLNFGSCSEGVEKKISYLKKISSNCPTSFVLNEK